MSLNDNGLITESIDAILSEKYIFNSIDGELNILIVEGEDDIQVISKYYFFNNNGVMPFRVCVGEDLGVGKTGKRSAIDSFYKYKESIPHMICLLDRDLDLILGKNESDERIIYYDFYELENYLFEENLLRIFVNRFYEFSSHSEFEEILKKISDLSKFYLPLSKLLLTRDKLSKELEDTIQYNNNSELEEKEKLNKIAQLAKQDLSKIILNNSQQYSHMDFLQKITYYLNEELFKVNLNLDYVEEKCCYEEVTATIDEQIDDFLVFKYFIGAKTVLKSIICLMEKIVSDDFNKVGTQISLEQNLKKEWIPNNSKKFAELMYTIETRI